MDNIDPIKIENAIQLLKTYVKDNRILPLISILEALKQDLNNQSLVTQLSHTLRNLDTIQGAVLTYAPYVNVLISDDPFGD